MTSPMKLRKKGTLTSLLAMSAFFIFLGGCGQQDLYEPPGAPFEIVGQVALPSANEGVDILDHYAFVAGGQAGLHVIDVSNPTNPVLIRTLNTTKYAESINVIRTFANHTLIDIALVVEGTEGITSYDITDPPNLTSFNQGTTAVDGNRIFVEEPDNPDQPFIVYLAESWKGIRIFQSNPDFPGLLQYDGVFASTQGYAKGIAVKDGYAYIADDEMGLAVMDVQELVLGSLELTSWADSPGNALDVAILGDHAYVADGTEGLAIYAIDGPNQPQRVSRIDLSGYNRSIAVRDDVAFLAAAGGGVHFVDVRNPSDPVYLGSVVTAYASDLALSNDGYVLVADRDDGLVILRGPGPFTDPKPPAPVTNLTATPYGIDSIELTWFATGDDGMIGQARACEIRFASTAIDSESVWDNASTVPNPPAPAIPGAEQSMIVTGLERGTEYHFAIKISDEAGKTSSLGNSVAATTFSGIVLRDPSLDRQVGTTEDLFTYEVTYRYGSAPTVFEIIIDGTDHHDMTYVSGDYLTGALYRFATSLSTGAHTYSFYFDTDDADPAELAPADGPFVGAIAFQMGSLDTEPGREQDETYHGVALTDSVLAWPYEITQSDWEAPGIGLVDSSSFDGPDLPVENITWFEAVDYCNRRSLNDGLTPAYTIAGENVTWDRNANGWRLPTEAEWEWFCRSGNETAFAGGDITETMCGLDPVLDLYGWYCGNAGTSTHPVGQKQANAPPFNLYDMHGNVWEWCWDWYAEIGSEPQLDPEGPASGFRRVIRGGSWYYYASDCRSASRGAYWPDSQDNTIGLRIVRTTTND